MKTRWLNKTERTKDWLALERQLPTRPAICTTKPCYSSCATNVGEGREISKRWEPWSKTVGSSAACNRVHTTPAIIVGVVERDSVCLCQSRGNEEDDGGNWGNELHSWKLGNVSSCFAMVRHVSVLWLFYEGSPTITWPNVAWQL